MHKVPHSVMQMWIIQTGRAAQQQTIHTAKPCCTHAETECHVRAREETALVRSIKFEDIAGSRHMHYWVVFEKQKAIHEKRQFQR